MWIKPVSAFRACLFSGRGDRSLCLLVFGRLGVGSIVAFLVAGLLAGAIRDLPDESVLALREFAELGVVLARWNTAVVLGLGFALSSMIVVVQILQDRDERHQSWGRRAFAILLAQNLAIVPFLLIVSLLSERGAGMEPVIQRGVGQSARRLSSWSRLSSSGVSY